MPADLTVEYCGEEYVVEPTARFAIGRDADLVVDDDNSFLHRRIIELSHDAGLWWIANVGSRLAVTVTGDDGRLQSVVGPGSRVPIVLPTVTALFTAGSTTYEVMMVCGVPAFEPAQIPVAADDGDGTTLGAVALTPSQFRLLLALSERVLRRVGTGPRELPTNTQAAARLGWPITTFNRKLDNVCDKYSRAGVKGLRGGPGANAVGRRARLVEYVVSAQIVRSEHLPLLDERESA